MYGFIQKVFLFLCCMVAYFAFNAMANWYIIAHTSPPLHASRLLVIGDSHPQKGIDPSILESCENVGQTAEPYLITYYKLKKLLPLVKPDTVIIGFAQHNISAFNDVKFTNTFSTEMFKRTYGLINFLDIDGIALDYKEYFSVLFKQMCFYPHTNHYKYIEPYSNDNTNVLTDVDETIRRHYYQADSSLWPVSTIQIAYLDSIVDVCRKVNCTPILVGVPVYKGYYEKIPVHISAAYKFTEQRMAGKGIVVIDYTAVQYSNDEYMNSDHLNQKGAIQFTNTLNQIIQGEN